MKKLNKKGFTMAELLIVVAIIAVLVAIAIPVFTAQLNKSRLATATANARSAYAEATAEALQDGSTVTQANLSSKLGTIDSAGCTITSTSTQITISNAAGSNTIKISGVE